MSQPATPGQLRFFLLDGQEGGAARTLVKHITVDGPVDPDRLHAALREVIGAQPALRTSLHLEPEGLVQRLHPVESVSVDIELSPAAAARTLPLAARDAAAAPFVHGEGPLCRVWAVVGPELTHCLVSVHHAVFDEDSSTILLRQLAAAYAEPGSLTARQDGAASGPDAEREAELRRFWAGHLADCPQDTALPQAVETSGRQRAVHTGDVAAELAERIRARARSTGATPFTQFLAAIGMVAGWYADRRDLVLAVVAGCRGEDRAEQIGCLQNTVPVRLDLSEGDTGQILDRTLDALFDAVEHADLPIEEILACAGVVRQPGRKPLTQILCTEALPAGAVERAGLSWTLAELPPAEVEYDLGLTLCHLPDGGMRLDVEYRAGALSAAQVERLAEHLVGALWQLTDERGLALASLDLLTAAERAELPLLDGGPVAAAERPVHELVAEHARRAPEAIAVRTAEQSLTYGALEEGATALAAALAEHGVRPGDRVGLCLPRTPDLLLAVLAVWKVGAAYVPLDPEYPAERLRYMAEDAQLAVLLSDRELVPGIPVLGVPTTVVPGEAAAALPVSTPADPAYLIYTSGSTGRPKGVVVRHGNLDALFRSFDRLLGGPAPVTLAGTSLSFDISALELFWPLARGRSVLLTNHRWAAEEDVPEGSLYQCTPTVARLLVGDQDGREMLARLGTLLVGGEPLPADLAAELRSVVGGRVVNCYGPTETTVWSTVWQVAADTAVHIGRPLAGERCHVVDGLGRELPPGCPGRLLVSGAGVAEGYWQQPELTEERFLHLGGPSGVRAYDTGDLAVFEAPHGLRFLTRRDSQVKVLGQRVELEEIETALRTGPGVRDAAVAVSRGGAVLTALVVADQPPFDQPLSDQPPSDQSMQEPRPAPPAMAQQLREHATRWLTPAMVPATWLLVPRLPQLPNGKLDRGALVALAADLATAADAGPPVGTVPEGAVSAVVREAWGQVIEYGPDDQDATFFALGGTSSGLLRVLAALRPRYPGLTVADLFRHTTARSLAAHLESLQASGGPEDQAGPSDAGRGTARARALSGWRARAGSKR
ncbi:amino acid adenylation domain-containing protein [Kitasatospora aureofaciens]|uniref:non-ribosomal peptide synthetase n=1 Tax=Kitasatospora aureofaciens TaxID=1894 RepID=UPI001C4525EC|nr:amino acid adenylation domain-containing protein [Kitasatospora aureofaciens]MBV6699874.1 amino acid adenylation domain-containing protein [Kitasatospora aureofaciens]